MNLSSRNSRFQYSLRQLCANKVGVQSNLENYTNICSDMKKKCKWTKLSLMKRRMVILHFFVGIVGYCDKCLEFTRNRLQNAYDPNHRLHHLPVSDHSITQTVPANRKNKKRIKMPIKNIFRNCLSAYFFQSTWMHRHFKRSIACIYSIHQRKMHYSRVNVASVFATSAILHAAI